MGPSTWVKGVMTRWAGPGVAGGRGTGLLGDERKTTVVVLAMDEVMGRRGCRVGVAWVCGAWRERRGGRGSSTGHCNTH